MHRISHPSILYFGTPVVLISTVNPDGSVNLAPMSSIFWLGWRCVIGLAAASQTTANLLRTGEAVLNLASVREAGAVNRLARTTGSDPVPAGKKEKGYRHVKDKFRLAGLTPVPALRVAAPRVDECPVQLEAKLVVSHALAADDPAQAGRIRYMEMRIEQVHLAASILMDGFPDRVDPERWRPLMMVFQELYGLGEKQGPSVLAQIPESLYRTPDWQRARETSPEAMMAASGFSDAGRARERNSSYVADPLAEVAHLVERQLPKL